MSTVQEGNCNLCLHKDLTWLNISVSIAALILSLVILERPYAYDNLDFVDKLAFLVQGPHKESNWKFPIPPIYILVTSLLSAILTSLLLHMDRCSRSKTLSISASVYRKKKQEASIQKDQEMDWRYSEKKNKKSKHLTNMPKLYIIKEQCKKPFGERRQKLYTCCSVVQVLK